MKWFSELLRRLRYLRRRDELDADLAEEMRLHLELRAEQLAAEGASSPATTSRKQFGNVTRLQEKSRDAWGWGWLDSIGQDLRYGWRNLMSARGFTITAVLSLALGIGANTAIFSIINALLLRSLPVSNPHRIVKIHAAGNDHLTNPLWESIRDRQNAFNGVLAYSGSSFDLAQGGERRPVPGLWVSGDYFNVLGVQPLRGRLFNSEDDLPGGGKNGPVAVISHAFWQSHFGGDPAILGKPIRLDGHQFEIIGVTPPSFKGLEVDRSFSVVIPIGCEPMFHPDGSALKHRSWWWLRIVGRLDGNLTVEQANERLKVVTPAILEEALPDWDDRGKKEFLSGKVACEAAGNGFTGIGGEQRTMLFAMMGVVAVVLLIACANIANLLLARASARQQEISVRLAIGAGRRRLVRQLLTESLLLAALGIPGGLLIAKWGSQFLLKAVGNRPLEIDTSMDLRVLSFTVGITLLTGLIFGFAPALRATRVSTNEVLKQSARGSGNGGSRFRLGRAMVAGQFALSLALIVSAGLFVATLRNLLNVTLGFNQHNVLAMQIDVRGRVAKEQRLTHFQKVLDAVRNCPGALSAATTMIRPISGAAWNGNLFPEGVKDVDNSDSSQHLTFFNRVSPGYFETMQTPIILGRDFNEHDTLNSSRVIIISQKTARDYFGAENPIGKRLGLQGGPGAPEMHEVIGVAADAKYINVKEETRRTAYVTMAQDKSPWDGLTFLIRSSAPNFDALMPGLRAAMAQAAPECSLEFKSLETQISNSLSDKRLIAVLVAFFGALALLLAVIGLYGVTSYAAAQRQGEIGIRMALGAQRSNVIWLILRDVAIIIGIGSALGLAMSFGAGKLLASILYGIQPSDPIVLASAFAILAGAGALAGLLPALRASRLDPAIALRHE